jgi:2-keto-4-pentenoate hydratase/2-oxohepta-3-ene-1,7-dioic acid hydratase in catechol pathway
VAAPVLQVYQHDAWNDFSGEPPFPLSGAAGELESAPLSGERCALPFLPRIFREFMLYEHHAINATRGYARRFSPSLFPITRSYERLTGATFPKFKPKPLWYREPIYYLGNHLTFVPSGTPVSPPGYTRAFDYELELGFVLSKPLRNPTPKQAAEAIGAFVVVCDFSARDRQRAEMDSGFGPQKSKHFLNSMSTVAVSADEILPRVDRLEAGVEIDGKRVVTTSTAGMRYSLAEVIVHAAQDEQLFPGELFATGTVPGACALENGAWLEKGSRLRLFVEAVGDIEHSIL